MRRKARVDANHAEIREALRKAGWTVIDHSRIGSGWPDLFCAKHGRIELVEVKDGDKALSRQRLTVAERRVYDQLIAAGVRVRYVNSIEQAINL